MAKESSNIDLVQRAFAAASSGDWATFRSLASDDFTWHLPGRSRISGDTVGVDAFAAKVKILFGSGLEVELMNILGAGEHVATVARNFAASEDHELDIVSINLFTVIDGRVARMQSFPSDLYALDAFWGPAQS